LDFGEEILDASNELRNARFRKHQGLAHPLSLGTIILEKFESRGKGPDGERASLIRAGTDVDKGTKRDSLTEMEKEWGGKSYFGVLSKQTPPEGKETGSNDP